MFKVRYKLETAFCVTVFKTLLPKNTATLSSETGFFGTFLLELKNTREDGSSNDFKATLLNKAIKTLVAC